MQVKGILALVVATAAVASCYQLPEFIKPCKRNDNECLKKTLQSVIPKLGKGYRPFGLLPLDPMRVEELVVDYKMDDVEGKMAVRNADTYGLAGIRIQDVRSFANATDFYMEVDVKFPEIFIEGAYKANGQVVVFPIRGNGVFNISMSDVAATWKLTGHVEDRDGEAYLRLDHFTMRPEVGDMKVYASDLFTGSPELNEAALRFANQFWPLVYGVLLPYVEGGWDRVMTGVANKVFQSVPYSALFPQE
ncbi:protein takeout-like [Bacillus rossius redtenbacheri]|uniref:protein takeout-like n=1 Tax=Bacillus rossius redtenbacheri TaxID=93214 RepID=UPI002FDE7C39